LYRVISPLVFKDLDPIFLLLLDHQLASLRVLSVKVELDRGIEVLVALLLRGIYVNLRLGAVL
jgi:hypothetical protein